MQDFDALRHRVEETAERLSLAQSERRQEIQSLIGTLHDLEQKYSAQEKQFAYYRARLQPLERTNAQLTALIENLLDLIDQGFGEDSLDSLRKASEMASTMLRAEVDEPGAVAPDLAGEASGDAGTDEAVLSNTGPMTEDTVAEFLDPGDDGMSEEVAEAAPEIPASQHEEVVAADGGSDEIEMDDTPDGDLELVAFDDAAAEEGEATEAAEEPEAESLDLAEFDDVFEVDADEAAATADEATDEQDENPFDEVADLELEEVALSNLEDDIEDMADNSGPDLGVIAAMDLSETITTEAPDAMAAADVRFEEVSDSVLKLELEEEAALGLDDLPDVVKTASAAFASGDTSDEVDAIATLTAAMEEETRADKAQPPKQSDIRSLLLRVEALAKKAEAMRLAQAEEMDGSDGDSDAAQSAETAASAESEQEADDRQSATG